MAATGFVAFSFPLLSQLDAPLTLTLAVLLSGVWTIGYVALLLTFMTGGRLESAVDRVLVGLYALALLVLQVPFMMFLEFEGNLLLVRPDADIANAIDDARLWLTVATTLAIVGVIAQRWRAASRPRRKALLPGVMGIISGLLYVVQLLVVLLAEQPYPELPFWLTSFALLLVPAAYLVGLLRSRLARGGLAELFLGVRTMRGAELQAALGARSATPAPRSSTAAPRSPTAARRRRSSATASGSRRSSTTRRSTTTRSWSRRSPRRPRSRSRTSACTRSRRRGSRSCGRRASGSSLPATRSGGGSSATCTTAHSSGWCRSRCSCG